MSILNNTSDAGRAAPSLRAFVESLPSPNIDTLLIRMREGHPLSLSGLAGSLKAVIAARIFLAAPSQLLFVCPQTASAEKTEADLAAILGEETVCSFPDYDTLPGGKDPPHNRIVEDRLRAYGRLASAVPCVVVTTTRSLVQKTITPALFERRALDIAQQEAMGLDSLVEWLLGKGFERRPIIEDIGQFSVRGGIVDIFPFLADNPLRIEFWGDTIESIRAFDVFSQRSVEKLEKARIVPMTEIPGDDEASVSILAHLKPGACVLFDETGPPEALCATVVTALKEAWAGEGCAPREELLCTAAGIQSLLAGRQLINIHAFAQDNDFSFNAKPAHAAQGGTAFFTDFRLLIQNGYTVTVLCENSGQQSRFKELATEADVSVATVIGNVDEGFILPNDKIAVFTENRLFNRYMHRLKFRKWKGGTTIHHVSALKKGDIVVHMEHGIGRFMGLERVRVGSLEKDCVNI